VNELPKRQKIGLNISWLKLRQRRSPQPPLKRGANREWLCCHIKQHWYEQLVLSLARGARGELKRPIPCFLRGIRGVPIALSFFLISTPVWSQPQPQKTPSAADLDLKPEIIENSPVLQRWMRQVPNVLEDIKRDPSFRTRLRLGYSLFPSTDNASGVNFGVEDLFISKSGFTISGDYQAAFDRNRSAYGVDLRYYVRPLGSYINFAPILGYRHIETGGYATDGVNLGARLLLVLSRDGAADIALSQSWISPGTDDEVGLTTLSFGYAVTRDLRLSTDLQQQNSRQDKDSRLGIVLEWML
jgi:hypothetical protein